MAGEVTLTAQLGKEHLPVTGGSQVAYVLVEATPTEMMAQVRMPLNFSIVLDRSGSMKGPKLIAVKRAVQMLIDQMADTDTISVIAFDDGVQIVVPAQPAMDKAGIQMAVDRIRDGGGTTMSLGMSTGLSELNKYYSPTSVNRMVILSDGVTYGDTQRCRDLAQEAGSRGINIYPLGIGSDWDEDLLDNIGRRSGGSEAEFIRQPGDALSIFQQQFQSAAAVAVRNAQLVLHLSAGITPKKAVKVLPQIADLGPAVLTDRQVVISLGDLEKETPQAVLFELMVEPKPAGVFRIAVAELSYDVPTMSRTGEQLRADIVIGFSQDATETQPVNALVMNYAEKANAHRLVTKVLEEYKTTGKVTTQLAPNVTRVLDQETQAALEALSAGKPISNEQVKSIGNKTRKLTQRLDDF